MNFILKNFLFHLVVDDYEKINLNSLGNIKEAIKPSPNKGNY
jgi:hypothetical protein